MNGTAEPYRHVNQVTIVLVVIAAGLIIGILLLPRLGDNSGSSGLLPPLPTPTPVPGDISNEPVPLTLSALNQDPFAYVNKVIRVSGAFTPLTAPTCERYNGPVINWALVDENLQLDVVGFEQIVGLVPPGTTMTVEGVWQRYEGPLGCGKGAARGSAWYLAATRILEPNPLVGAPGAGVGVESGAPDLPALLPTRVPTETPTAFVTPTPTATTAALVTVGPVISPTAGSATATPAGTQATATATLTTPGAPQPTLPGTAVGTPSPTSPAGSGTTAPTSTPEAPLPVTNTPVPTGGYPGPPTATPTASGGYP